MPEQDLNEIIKNFKVADSAYLFDSLTTGLINKSYIVREEHSVLPVYFLQQIDSHVFPNIEGLMQNIQLVVGHFSGLKNPPDHLDLIPTHRGDSFYKTSQNEYWRLYYFKAGESIARSESPAIAVLAGESFGHFLVGLDSLEPAKLQITIPDFHNIDYRYNQFNESIKMASAERLATAHPLIDLVEHEIGEIKAIYGDIKKNSAMRVTHNDTKLSNLIFTQDFKNGCVVDYDTLMPGFIAFDFADCIRTMCSTTMEDDTDLANTKFNLDMIASFTTSFISSIKDILTWQEAAILAAAVPYLPFLMGLRMLTDYLNNDIYYTINYKEHNFDRASNQLTLYKSGKNILPEINTIVLNNFGSQTY